MSQSDRTSLAVALLLSLVVHAATLATVVPRGHETLPAILSVYLPAASERSGEAPRSPAAPAEEALEPQREPPAPHLERRHSVASAAPTRPSIVEPARAVRPSAAPQEAPLPQPATERAEATVDQPSAVAPAGSTTQAPPASSPLPRPSGQDSRPADVGATSPAPASSTQLAMAPETSAGVADERLAASALKSYGQAISTILDRYKAYPLDARLHGWQGEAMIRLRVAPSGLLLGAELERSSGHEILDRKALAIASEVRQLPAPPKELGNRELAITVPIVFRFQSD